MTVLAVLSACGDPKPVAPVLTLAPPADTVVTPYADVTDAAWLGGDRWAVLAPGAATVGIVDFSAGTIVPLGGKGSSALQHPFTLFTVGDTLFVADWGKRRLTAWSADGRMRRAIPALDAARGALPRAGDATGRFYIELYPVAGSDGSGNHDSAVVLRTVPGASRLDTIARLAPLDIKEITTDAGRRFERRVFSGADQWGVLPDGSVWLARVYHNRVDWIGPDGEHTRGEPLPDRVLEVTRYDRELFLRKFPPELRQTAEQLPFAPIKPPFERGMTGPMSLVWLEKSRAPIDSARGYHVVDRAGQLVRDVRVPGAGRILAVAPGVALIAEPSKQGIRLLRYAVPSPF